jgi:nitric oxide dioxygenase
LTAQVFEQGAAAGSPAGRPTLDQLRGWVPADAEVYVLGPKPFMGFVDRTVAEIGVPEQRRHHEFFGPAEALA